MVIEEESTKILRTIFEKSLDNIIKDKSQEIGIEEDKIDILKRAYEYLFTFAYGKNWSNNKEDIMEKVEELVLEAVGDE